MGHTLLFQNKTKPSYNVMPVQIKKEIMNALYFCIKGLFIILRMVSSN